MKNRTPPTEVASEDAPIYQNTLLGDEIDQWQKLAGKSDMRLHLYGKGEARPGRKMAHVNRVRPL